MSEKFDAVTYVLAAALALCLLLPACGGDDATDDAESCNDPAVRAAEPLCALDEQTTTCDFLIAEKCLLPYPSSVFLKPDSATVTGLRVNYARESMPVNAQGIHIDPAEWNTLDGFSPGPLIIALFPQGVDLAASAVAPLADMAGSLEPDSPTVLIEAETGERVLHGVELDAQASSPARQGFLIRPGVRLREATRYIVAIRRLKDLNGDAIPATRPFAILRDQLPTPVQTINARRAAFEDVFTTLSRAGIGRNDLILAWEFVTASSESLTARAISLRDQGLATNGPGAPPFTVTSIEDDFSDRIFRRVRGTFTVPQFMSSATPPAFYNLDANGVPQQNGFTTAPFTVTIPRIAQQDGPTAGRAVVYGHGLFGTGEGEITADNLQTLAQRFNFILAATDWVGMSQEDTVPLIGFFADLSNFRGVPDRLQQAMLNFMLLGRLLTAADGFASHAAFQFDGLPIIDPGELYYYGISLGGIEGGAFMALSTETMRGVLGVPAANFSIVLQRAVGGGTAFQALIDQAYPDELDSALALPLMQQLWDRGEPQGYVSHLVDDPLPGTPAKKILMQMGVYDAAVSNIGTAIEVRSLGIPSVAPSSFPIFQVPESTPPFDGSAFVAYDVNAVAPPQTNTAALNDNGVHEAIRRLDAAQQQIDAFLRPDGSVQDFCGGPCFFRDVPGVTMR